MGRYFSTLGGGISWGLGEEMGKWAHQGRSYVAPFGFDLMPLLAAAEDDSAFVVVIVDLVARCEVLWLWVGFNKV